ncbi:hypothetical protein KY329_00285, partial [Candidatus Woesearchaeota archaeon]|nr:hypothetical protein [Candidatus Woesearchaeota archaeon]
MKDLKQYEALINALPEYEAWKYIAEGGAGTVFETVHRPTGQKRAIKWYVTKEHALRRNMITASEIGKDATLQTAKRIFNHPNLVQIYETAFVNIDRAEYLDEITKRDAEYVTMEFVRGKPISKIPRECFTLTEIQEVMNGAIAGVGHIHKQGFVHGDPTDNNILVPDSKIIDYDLLVPINTKIDIN